MECVELALTKMLMADMRRDLRNVLIAEAKEYVLKACCRKLYNWLKVSSSSRSAHTIRSERQICFAWLQGYVWFS